MSKYKKDEAHIVYASDDRFAEILGVSLVSLYENSKDVNEITVYILEDGIRDENKERIESICVSYGRKAPVWIEATNIAEVLTMEVSIDRGSLTQYSRLFISNDLPDDLHRILYLDCDIIVNKSISELWNIDLQDNTIGALKEAFSPYYRKNIDLKKDDLMFNSGVMLIDLDRWRDGGIEERLKAFIKRHNGKIQQGDQGALNAVLSRDTYVLDPRFNAQTYFFDFSYKEILTYRKPRDLYTEEEIERAKENPSIIHFTTSFSNVRPWYEGCTHRYVEKWKKYKNMSPWKDTVEWKKEKSKSRFIADKMPRKLMISMVGIVHGYVRPIILEKE